MGIEPFESLAAGPLPSGVAPVSSRASGGGCLFVVCGACRGVLRLPKTAAGITGRCPSCMKVIQVPAREIDPEAVRRVLVIGIPATLGLSSAAAFVLGLVGVVGAALSGQSVSGVSWVAALCGGLGLGAAVAFAYAEQPWAGRAWVGAFAIALVAGALGGFATAAPALGMGLMLLGASQVVGRVSAPTQKQRPRPARTRVTSRPRPAVGAISA